MPLTTRRLSRVLLALPLALSVVVASPASAAEFPERIDLPTRSDPEGISSGQGTEFFAGARNGGAIVKGDLRTGETRTLVAADGGAAVGMLHDSRSDLLWVAGGTAGTVTAYDSDTGARRFRITDPAAAFLNDVAITRDAVYVTDSRRAALVVVPLGPGGVPRTPFRTLALTGDYTQPAGFGANGIRALPGGDLVLVSGGVLYRVDTSTGRATRIEQVGQRRLSAGDGLVLQGSTLYVVNGFGGDEVVVVDLGAKARTARVTGVLTDTDLDRPTTATLVAGRLWVVNGRFGTLAKDPEAPVYISQVALR